MNFDSLVLFPNNSYGSDILSMYRTDLSTSSALPFRINLKILLIFVNGVSNEISSIDRSGFGKISG